MYNRRLPIALPVQSSNKFLLPMASVLQVQPQTHTAIFKIGRYYSACQYSSRSQGDFGYNPSSMIYKELDSLKEIGPSQEADFEIDIKKSTTVIEETDCAEISLW